jgi:hypothetical protein
VGTTEEVGKNMESDCGKFWQNKLPETTPIKFMASTFCLNLHTFFQTVLHVPFQTLNEITLETLVRINFRKNIKDAVQLSELSF